MKLIEFDIQDASTGYYDPSRDEFNTRHINDTRKPKLTLMGLNRLKRMRAMSKLEKLKRQDLLDIMYGSAGDAGGGGMPGF